MAEISQVEVGGSSYDIVDSTVPSWAKAESKPSYNFSEINNTPTTIGDYGITDAYTKTEVDGLIGSGGTVTTWWGTCSTDASTATKIVECEDFTLTTGAIIGVYFSNRNTSSSVNLNVNGTGAKQVRYGNNSVSGTINQMTWTGTCIIWFQYDGNTWEYLASKATGVYAPIGGAGVYGAFLSTGSTLAAKACSSDCFTLQPGALVVLYCSMGNSVADAITLNVSGSGDKPIYINNTATSTTNPLLWTANDVLTFIYDGSHWRFVARSKIPTKTSELTNDSGFITSPEAIDQTEDSTLNVIGVNENSNTIQYNDNAYVWYDETSGETTFFCYNINAANTISGQLNANEITSGTLSEDRLSIMTTAEVDALFA